MTQPVNIALAGPQSTVHYQPGWQRHLPHMQLGEPPYKVTYWYTSIWTANGFINTHKNTFVEFLPDHSTFKHHFGNFLLLSVVIQQAHRLLDDGWTKRNMIGQVLSPSGCRELESIIRAGLYYLEVLWGGGTGLIRIKLVHTGLPPKHFLRQTIYRLCLQ